MVFRMTETSYYIIQAQKNEREVCNKEKIAKIMLG